MLGSVPRWILWSVLLMLIDELQDALLHSQVSGHVSPGTPWRPYLLALPVRIGWTWWWRCAVHPPLISTTSLLYVRR